MKKILVTGGAGYIGSILVPSILELGNEVTVYDSLIHNQNSLLESCANKNFSFIQGDICNYQEINKILPQYDVVILLAALVGAPACKKNVSLSNLVNYEAHVNILDNVSDEQRVIFPNTNSGYGIGGEEICTENSPLNPISEYGVMKCKVEELVMERRNSISFRLATVFGMSPRMRTDLLVNDFVYRAFNDKYIVLFEEHFRRNYIHIRDVAKAFIQSIDDDLMIGECFNLGLSSANLSKIELAEKIKFYLPEFVIHTAEIGEDPDKRDYIVSNEKLEKTGWHPDHSLDDGIQELIKGYSIIRENSFTNA